MALELIPAVDLLGGKVVRLRMGAYDQVTEYHQDPLAQALAFEEQGAKRLHVVDLDAARSGEQTNHRVIERLLAKTGLQIQVGGGIRSEAIANNWLSSGVHRVVVGTMAVRDPESAARLCANHPHQVVVAVDGRAGKVAISGWEEQSDVTVEELSLRAQDWGAAAVLFTDISKDGMGEGPSTGPTCELQARLQIDVIASGGIGSLDDVIALDRVGLRQAVCGRALYEGAFTLRHALEAIS